MIFPDKGTDSLGGLALSLTLPLTLARTIRSRRWRDIRLYTVWHSFHCMLPLMESYAIVWVSSCQSLATHCLIGRKLTLMESFKPGEALSITLIAHDTALVLPRLILLLRDTKLGGSV